MSTPQPMLTDVSNVTIEGVQPDGARAVLILHSPTEAQCGIVLDRATVARLAIEMTRLHFTCEARASAAGLSAQIVATECESLVQTGAGERDVLMVMLTPEPLLMHYKLTPDHAEMLGDQLRVASAAARANCKSADN